MARSAENPGKQKLAGAFAFNIFVSGLGFTDLIRRIAGLVPESGYKRATTCRAKATAVPVGISVGYRMAVGDVPAMRAADSGVYHRRQPLPSHPFGLFRRSLRNRTGFFLTHFLPFLLVQCRPQCRPRVSQFRETGGFLTSLLKRGGSRDFCSKLS